MNQTEVILNYLKQGYSITPLEALEKFGCMRLGARIWDLHKQGYNVKSEITRGRDGKHYARYYIPQNRQREFNYGNSNARQCEVLS